MAFLDRTSQYLALTKNIVFTLRSVSTVGSKLFCLFLFPFSNGFPTKTTITTFVLASVLVSLILDDVDSEQFDYIVRIPA